MPDIRTWSRADSYLLEGQLTIVFAIIAAYGVVLQLLNVLGLEVPGAVKTVEVGINPTELGHIATQADVDVGSTGEIVLVFTDPSAAQRLLLALPSLLVGVTALAVVYLLFRIARTIRTRDPFVPANARRLLAIAVLAIVSGIAVPTVELMSSSGLLDAATAGASRNTGISTGLELSLFPVLLGLLLAALADVFRRGAALRADTEGLV